LFPADWFDSVFAHRHCCSCMTFVVRMNCKTCIHQLPFAMRLSGFTDEESKNSKLQMRVRRLLLRGTPPKNLKCVSLPMTSTISQSAGSSSPEWTQKKRNHRYSQMFHLICYPKLASDHPRSKAASGSWSNWKEKGPNQILHCWLGIRSEPGMLAW
jgi:hypothetical protein